MRILGTEPSSVILSQTKQFRKVDKLCPKIPKQAEAKKDGVINPQQLQFQCILTRKSFILSKRYESTEFDRRTWLHVPSGTHWSTSSNTHQVLEIYKIDFY